MYTAVHSYSFRDRFEADTSFDVFQMIAMAAEQGFRGVEIMTGGAGSPPTHIGSDDPHHLERVVAYADARRVSVHCFSTYNDFAYVADEKWRLANIAYVKHWTRLAGQVGVPNIRLLTGYLSDKEPAEKLEGLVRDAIRECVSVAEEVGVNLALENHSSVIMAGREIEQLIAEIGSPRLTTCPDPSNWSSHFFDPDCPADERESVYQDTKILAPRATNSHLKIRGVDGEGLVGFDLDRLLGIYTSAGYQGPLTFESIADGDLIAPLAEARTVVERAITKAMHTEATPHV